MSTDEDWEDYYEEIWAQAMKQEPLSVDNVIQPSISMMFGESSRDPLVDEDREQLLDVRARNPFLGESSREPDIDDRKKYGFMAHVRRHPSTRSSRRTRL